MRGSRQTWQRLTLIGPHALGSSRVGTAPFEKSWAMAWRHSLPSMFFVRALITVSHFLVLFSSKWHWRLLTNRVFLCRYQVDLYVCGHTHSYSRSLPVWNGIIDAQPRLDQYDSANGTRNLYLPFRTPFFFRLFVLLCAIVLLRLSLIQANATVRTGTTLIVVGGAGCDEMNDELQANLTLAEVRDISAPYDSQVDY